MRRPLLWGLLVAVVATLTTAFSPGGPVPNAMVETPGEATLITRPDELCRAEALGLHSWAPGTRDHFVRIHAEMVSGRRLLGAQAGNFAGVGCG
jgi:hypothetical protein